jgi:hypothetical protein
MTSEPRYMLSQRAADALRPLIAPRTRLGSRPREIHDPAPPAKAERLPFRVELETISSALHAVVPYAWTSPTLGTLNDRLVTIANYSVPKDSALVASGGKIDLGALTTATNFWLVVTPPSFSTGSPADGSWTIVSQVALPVSDYRVTSLNGPWAVLLGSWTPAGGLVRTWPGGVFAFSGLTGHFAAVTKIRKSGSTLYWTLSDLQFDGGFSIAGKTDDERSISL